MQCRYFMIFHQLCITAIWTGKRQRRNAIGHLELRNCEQLRSTEWSKGRLSLLGRTDGNLFGQLVEPPVGGRHAGECLLILGKSVVTCVVAIGYCTSGGYGSPRPAGGNRLKATENCAIAHMGEMIFLHGRKDRKNRQFGGCRMVFCTTIGWRLAALLPLHMVVKCKVHSPALCSHRGSRLTALEVELA